MEAEINLKYKNEKEAQAVTEAVSPDNMEVPTGLKIQTVQKGAEVNTKIQCQKNLSTLIGRIHKANQLGS